jgi:hypothetical protein
MLKDCGVCSFMIERTVFYRSRRIDNNNKYCACTEIYWIVPEGEHMNSSIHRALVFQGGGSLGAYEAGAYKDINEELSRYLKGLAVSEDFCRLLS